MQYPNAVVFIGKASCGETEKKRTGFHRCKQTNEHNTYAYDIKIAKAEAVKVIHDELSNDPVFTERFETEAWAASSLNHPNIIRVISFGQDHEHRYIVRL